MAADKKKRKTKESDFQKEIVTYAQFLGWSVVHVAKLFHRGRWFTPAIYDGKGFPDLLLVRDSVMLFVEVKTDYGELTKEQKAWRNRILRCGLTFFVARPSNANDLYDILRNEGSRLNEKKSSENGRRGHA